MLYRIASGQHIDTDKTEPFSAQLDDIYANPFEKKTAKAKKMTPEEIKGHVVSRIKGLLQEMGD